ncbi:MAG: exported protein of unknown function [Candidatus Saccharibacteria bacterium]|nr:exported protein of unknown function [Candidatus Saccharibacteria bacterium]
MKSRLKRVISLALMATLFVTAPAFAQATTTMTDGHIAKIRTNCQAAILTLGQIHANDAPAYINRNQTYFSISDKLMARLNSRLTLNRYDATQLVKTASEYNSELAKFRTAYKTYDDSMSTAANMDCIKEPVSFYDRVSDARDARQAVRDIVDQLTSLINQYQQQVQAFQAQHFSSQAGSDNS